MKSKHKNHPAHALRTLIATALLLFAYPALTLFGQAPDFYKEFMLDKKVNDGVTQVLEGGLSLTAIETQDGPGVVLSLHDDQGRQAWTYRYKANVSAWKLEPAAILQTPHSNGQKAVVAGTLYLHAPEEENYYTSDFWLMEIDLVTGNPVFSQTFGTAEKDVCKGIIPGKTYHEWVPPSSLVPVPTFILYGFSHDYDHYTPLEGQYDLLVTMTNHTGQVIDQALYGLPVNDPNDLTNHFPSDAVYNPYGFVISGTREQRTQTGNNSSSHKAPFALSVDLSNLSNASLYTYDPGFSIGGSLHVDLDYAGAGFNFWKELVLSCTSDKGEAMLIHTYNYQADWSKAYATDHEFLEPRGVRNNAGKIAVLCRERTLPSLYADEVGLLILEEDGNAMHFNRFKTNGYPEPRSLQKRDGGLVAHSQPLAGVGYGGFALMGTDAEGNNSGSCYEEVSVTQDDINVSTDQPNFTTTQPNYSENELPMSQIWEWGDAFDCEEGWEHSFFGPEQHYGFYPVRQAANNVPVSGEEWYPLPLSSGEGILHIALEVEVKGSARFEVHDMAGRRLMQRDFTLEEGANVLEVPVAELPSGAFIATLSGPDGILSRKKITK